MKRKLSRLLEPTMAPYFALLLVFAAATAAADNLPLAVGEAAAALLAFCIYRIACMQRSRGIHAFIQQASPSMDAASHNGDVPLPMAAIRISDQQILWGNDAFFASSGLAGHLFEVRLCDAAPDFSLDWLTEGQSFSPQEVTFSDKRYRVFGNLVQTEETGGFQLLAMLYFIEMSDLLDLRDDYVRTRPVAAIILIDNYDELTNGLTDSKVSALSAQLGQRISDYLSSENGSLHELSRSRYLFFCQTQNLSHLIDEHFSILESIREVKNPAGLPATVSIGIGRDGDGFQEDFSFAGKALEMCLYRGGDQVVIKGKGDENYTYYGGRTKEGEHRTSVRARVIAGSLKSMLSETDSVFIMGHTYPDYDAVGSAAGIGCLCRHFLRPNVPFYILHSEVNAAGQLIDLLQKQPEYHGVFISEQEALQRIEKHSLLIVTDTNRPDQTASPQLLEMMLQVNRVVVIDHHRRAADFITPCVLAFHEPSASSASELVTELLQHSVSRTDILPVEAEALLAGIVLDTKQFSARTGTRTFESAAYLRQAGASPTDVKKLFQSNLADTLAKQKIVGSAFLYRRQIAVSMLEHTVEQTIAAQAADTLLNIQGVTASFVLYPTDSDQIKISARSISGGSNVQRILEPLGGGGNQEIAAALVLADGPSVLKRLCRSIDRCLDEEESSAVPESKGSDGNTEKVPAAPGSIS